MNKEASMRAFFPFIHILRGLAPVIVMWAHLGPWFAMANMGNNWFVLPAWYAHVAQPLHLYQNGGHFGVLVFFLVSGFVITLASTQEDVFEFVVKRVFRIVPALAVALLVTYIARWISFRLGLGELTNTRADSWVDFVYALFLLDMLLGKNQVIGVTWSLVPEVMFYFLTAIFLTKTRVNPEKSTYLMIGAWVLFELIAAGDGSLSRMKYFSPYVAMLILGRVFYLADVAGMGWRKALPMALIIGVVFVLIYKNAHGDLIFKDPFAPIASYLLALCVFLAAMVYGFKKVPRLISFLADISLSLYLLHIPVGMLINAFGVNRGFSLTSILPISFAACIGCAWLCFKYVEQPSQRFARRALRWRAREVSLS